MCSNNALGSVFIGCVFNGNYAYSSGGAVYLAQDVRHVLMQRVVVSECGAEVNGCVSILPNVA